MRLTGPPTWVITGVVLKLLYATAPVSRSVRASGAWATVHNLNVRHLIGGQGEQLGLARRAFGGGKRSHIAGLIGLRRSRPAEPSRASSAAERGQTVPVRRDVRFAATLRYFHGRLLVPTAWRNCSSEAYNRQRLPVGEFGRAVAALGVEEIEQAGGAALIGVLADVARILGLLQVAGGVELHDFVVGAQIFVSG